MPVEVEVDNDPIELKVLGELQADSNPSILVSSVAPIEGGQSLLKIDESFDVKVSYGVDDIITMDYEKISDHIGRFTTSSMKLAQGEHYKIDVSSPFDEIEDVTAGSTVPGEIRYIGKDMVSFEKILPNLNGTDRKRFRYVLDFTLDPTSDERYVHIVPMRREVEKDGISEIFEYTNVYRPQLIRKFYLEQDACFILESKYGFLVDRNKLVDNKIRVMFETLEDPSEYFTPVEWQHKYMHLFTYAVTEDYYKYHISASSSLPVGPHNNAESVVFHSNIENGKGFLGSLNLRIDSVRIQN